ncbi:transglycosylase domain-containing protein [Alkalibacter rhizosphaerae]|uniref:Penicillin-binding protein 1A n=1 Tax=Alkalibacter rhizosphaerae TaxID=2815577 RepID=A0A974XHB3_9FIRM|nr:transglycosylase domain-containing protein [Alkalibacter rhizosphaerae]QSX08343.1 transglycosylase domain-containing protein [Alkalibacter rhizosphaerae]
MKKIGIGLLVLFFMVAMTGAVYLLSVKSVDLSDFVYRPDQKTLVYSEDGELIGELYSENRTYVTLDQMPDHLKEAVVAVEDGRFYNHHGYDVLGIVRATITNIKNGEIVEGASTITQQLVRNLFDEISTEQTLTRKIMEAKTAAELEKRYSKEQILEMYLNEIYLGDGIYGVQEASRKYFGKDVGELSLAQSALLAGLPQAPSAYQPNRYEEKARSRQEKVLRRMVAENLISLEEAADAIAEEWSVLPEETTDSVGRIRQGYHPVVEQMILEYGSTLGFSGPEALEYLKRAGLVLYGSVNSQLQEVAFKSMESQLKASGLPEADGVLVSVHGKTGDVLAYCGGDSPVDMASQPRQPGSTLKPFIYAAAMDQSVLTVDSLLLDEKTRFGDYQPSNVDGLYRGYVTPREAILQSLNVPAVQVMDKLGVESTMTYLQGGGFSHLTKEDYGLATALGGLTYGVTPLELSIAYSSFVNEGMRTGPYFVQRVENRRGEVLYEKGNAKPTSWLFADTANYMRDILIHNVVSGTGSKASNPLETGGKTGTSSQNRDLWFSGFTGDLVTTVWIGREDAKPVNGRSSVAAAVYGTYVTIGEKAGLMEDLHGSPTHGYEEETIVVATDAGWDHLLENGFVLENMITEIQVTPEERSLFEQRMMVGVYVDEESGKVFVEGWCDPQYKTLRFYREDQVPESCMDHPWFDFLYRYFTS